MSSKSQSSQGRNPSGSSSSSSGRNRAVESAVTRLLVSIKQLLESLTNWSLLKIDENQVSDVYVRLGNDFNQAVAAFASFNIDMSELMSVPDDLRNVLEQCLAEDATPDNLELYLPTVRQIITGLLQGLREKQSIYSRIARRGSETSGHERTDSRSSRADRASRKAEPTHRPQGSRTVSDTDRPEREGSERESIRRSAHASGSRRKDTTSSHSRGATASDDGDFVGGFASPRSDAPRLGGLPFEDDKPAHPFDGGRRHRSQQSMAESAVSSSAASTPQSAPPPQLPPPDGPIPAPPSQPTVPASVKRYSLVDKPMRPQTPPTSPSPAVVPPVIVEPASPPPEQSSNQTSPAVDQANEFNPAMQNSLAALQKDNLLERRASKRFSSFNITKMTGGSGATRERSLRSHPHRRSLAAGGTLTPGDLAVLAEEGEEETEQPVQEQETAKRERSISRTATPDPTAPPVPKLPPQYKEPSAGSTSARVTSPQPPGDPNKVTVFLQVGREVKKTVVERNITFTSLRMLYIDKFAYNPGQGNFPAIYIRDPSSGVQYELEDLDELSEKCLLILNIEPLDQIKEHIDTQISALSNDIKELRSAVATTRYSQPPPPSIVTDMAEITPVKQPTERQYATAARRLSRFVPPSMGAPLAPMSPSATDFSMVHPQMTGQSLQPQLTGGSVLSEYSSRIVTDLKTQFDEVQNLRRDLGVMRQLYTGFMKQTKESLGALKKQTQSVKQLANTEIGGARTFIVTGKKKLDERTQTVLTDIEKLLDTVEGMKDDVVKRQMTPKEYIFKNMKKDLDNVNIELESLKEHIKTIRPMWKKTWEEELQNIVEEQQFLTHQEEFLNDLIEDHKSAVEMYGHMEKVISLRGPKLNGVGKNRPMTRQRSFPGGNPEEAPGSITNVMMEIRTAAIDSEKRMEAIEASQKNRQKELASNKDELQAELADFVGQKKLKLTGGAEEADRVRQKRSEATLRAMFNPGASTPVSEMPRTPPAV